MTTRKRKQGRKRHTHRRRRGGALIAQGAYGCVNRPPLMCADGEHDYKNKVSKLLSTSDADEELAEYINIDRIDPQYEFHLPAPTKCFPAPLALSHPDTKDCFVLKENPNLNDFSLLLMTDGGMDLMDFKAWNTIDVNAFLLEVKRLFMGVEQFIGADCVHTDIKPANIVLKITQNPPSMRLNYIDFGMMASIDWLATPDPNELGLWTYYPLEYSLIKGGVDANTSVDDVIKYLEQTTFLPRQTLLNDWDDFKQYYNHIASQVTLTSLPDLGEYKEPKIELQQLHNYIATHFDSYQLGLSLLVVLSKFAKRLSPPFLDALVLLFYQMTHLNLRKRIGIVEASRKYETILNTFILNNPVSATAVEVVENLETIPTSATNTPVYNKIQPIKLESPILAEPEMSRGGRRRRRR